MKRQVVKGFSMLMLIVGLAFMTAVVSANGQTSKRIVTDIPFEFVVGDKTMPAGQYEVRQMTIGGEVLLISNRETNAAVVRLTKQLPAERNTQARLVFHCYGQRYFLAEAWSGGDSDGKLFKRSRQERAIERELGAIDSKIKSRESKAEATESTSGANVEVNRNRYVRVELLSIVY